ncbi:SOS response-associated peptidase [Maribacter sp. HTCC2170]|uniref:SOS response-associated peptidase n=1 Tax=Maribacter sp. (strain HTCC2170 / KCCM 42371) TaxID=313603 RepID=UPI00006AFC4C|nr:SOS response-associated peptidase family protein [Maribacter sp. HTCC2170]EAR01391.1 hypothetical protein FB2170_11741 [Maribacter sp. HTCC2170]
MCYSIEQRKPLKQLEFRFKVKAVIPNGLSPDELQFYHGNGFAHPLVAVIPQENPKFVTPLMWGLVPHWESKQDYKEYYKNSIRYGSGLNAKNEKLFSSDMYIGSSMDRRCIVPLTGLHEPHHTNVIVSGSVFKVPFRFARRDDEFMNVAGIYDFTNDGMATFSILTKEATPLFSKIHNKKNRRPVILQDKDVDTWLNNDSPREKLQEIIDNDLRDDDLIAYPINRDLYKTKVDTNNPGIIEKVDYGEVEIDYDGKVLPEPPRDLFN